MRCASRLSLILHSCHRGKVKNISCKKKRHSYMCRYIHQLVPGFLTIFVHASLETLFKPTSLALVSVSLVNGAPASSSLTPMILKERFLKIQTASHWKLGGFHCSSYSPVNKSSSHTAFEEATAAIAGIDTIMFATAWIRTHFTK